MHFRAQLTVMLNQPLAFVDSPDVEAAVGYLIVIGVNAPDLAGAMRHAHDVALRPKKADGSLQSYDGIVVKAEVHQIERDDWETSILQNAERIDQEGVYYTTGLIFFGADVASEV